MFKLNIKKSELRVYNVWGLDYYSISWVLLLSKKYWDGDEQRAI